jgi:hypothetical protein
LGELILYLAQCWNYRRPDRCCRLLDISPAEAGAAPAPSTAANAAAVAILDSFITSPLLFSFVHVASTFDLTYWLFYRIHNQRDWNQCCSSQPPCGVR